MAFGYEDSPLRFQGDDGRWFWQFSDRVLPVISGGSDLGPGAVLDAQGNLIIPPTSTPPAPTQDPSNPPPFGTPPPRFWTQEEMYAEIERVRKEEKDKLYPAKNQTEQALAKTLADLETLKNAETTRQQALADAEAEAQRVAAEAEMTANQRLDVLRREMEERNRHYEEELAMRDAVMQREREFFDLENYAARVLAANSENIIPQLADIESVRGNTQEEIDAKVKKLVEKSMGILQDMRDAQSGVQRSAPGVSTSSPPMGPQEMLLNGQKTFTPEALAAMSQAEYASIRHLLPTGRSGGGGRGLFG